MHATNSDQCLAHSSPSKNVLFLFFFFFVVIRAAWLGCSYCLSWYWSGHEILEGLNNLGQSLTYCM